MRRRTSAASVTQHMAKRNNKNLCITTRTVTAQRRIDLLANRQLATTFGGPPSGTLRLADLAATAYRNSLNGSERDLHLRVS